VNAARRHYLLLTLAISATAFTGFTFTYFGPMARGAYPELSPTVHLHGWSFFLWYLLLPLQAGLISAKKTRLHRKIGMGSIGLAVVMVLTGLVVATVRIHRALPEDGSPYWKSFGPLILATLIVFVVFYVLGIRNRRDREFHKRCMIVASAGALGAAVFRILGVMSGFADWATPVGCGVPVAFVLAGMAYDKVVEDHVHTVYVWGLVAILAAVAVFPLTISPVGPLMSRSLGALGAILGVFY
jgi:FtsH-binding integral membrane protein